MFHVRKALLPRISIFLIVSRTFPSFYPYQGRVAKQMNVIFTGHLHNCIKYIWPEECPNSFFETSQKSEYDRKGVFLDAPSHLYKWVCPSVSPSLRLSICPMLFSKVKSTHTRRILCRVSGLVFMEVPGSPNFHFINYTFLDPFCTRFNFNNRNLLSLHLYVYLCIIAIKQTTTKREFHQHRS